MTDTTELPTDASISDRIDRLEGIIDQLEEDELPLEQAKDRYVEGRRLLEELRDDLGLEEGVLE